MMRIVYDVPPLYDEIDAAFQVKGRQIIFAWGDRIYMPGMASGLSKALYAHEGQHTRNQHKIRNVIFNHQHMSLTGFNRGMG